MASWLNSFFNTRKTHVANGSDRPIWAMVDMDRERVTSATANVHKDISASVNIELYHTAAKNGYSKVMPGGVFAFHMGTGLNDSVYITIFQEGDREPLCSAAQKRNNHSVIVGSDGQVHDTKMGTYWTDDITGRDWSR